MTHHAYFHTQDNTIAECELSRADTTADAFAQNREEAAEMAEFYGWLLIGIWGQQWSDSKWDHEYARLERYGFFTAERRAILFDI